MPLHTSQDIETEFLETILKGDALRNAFKEAIADFFKDGIQQCVIASFCAESGLQIIKVHDSKDIFNDFLNQHDQKL